MSRKKVLLVSEYYPPHWTGLAKAFSALADEIAKNHSVTVLTIGHERGLPTYEIRNGVTIKRAPYLFQISRTHYSLQILFLFVKAVRDFDLVVLNSPNSNILFLAALTKLFGKRLQIFHQGDLILPRSPGKSPFKSLGPWLIEKAFDILTGLAMKLADRVSTYTEDYARHSRVMKHSLNKFSALIPPFPIADLLPRSDGNGISPRIGFAGRFVDEKGFDVLFRAIPFVVAVYPEAKFIFAGETHLFYENCFEKNAELIEKNRAYLIFLGRLSEPALAEFYRSLDVFVLCSRSDCFPLTQVEAALACVPIVCTDIPGARMLVKELGCGESVRSEDPADLARGILKVLQNREAFAPQSDRVVDFLRRYGWHDLA